MNLDDWLHAAPPADIYVLGSDGFDLFVTGSAGNALYSIQQILKSVSDIEYQTWNRDEPVEVKVIRKWGSSNQACANLDDKSYLDSLIKVGSCYRLTNYICEEESTTMKKVPHATSIGVGRVTKFVEILNNGFPILRPPVTLPPPSQPLSITDYTLSLLRSNPSYSPSTPFLIDSNTGYNLTYSSFIHQFQSLATSLLTTYPTLTKNDVALIISPTSLHIPVLYFALLSIGVTVSPVNPLSTKTELTDLIKLTKPVIAFATSASAKNLTSSFPLGLIIIDSPEFKLMLQYKSNKTNKSYEHVKQSDTAAILYSSGTTGRIKGVELTHRNFVSITTSVNQSRFVKDENHDDDVHPISLFPLPLFHVFGFFMLIRAFALGETLVLMERFDFEHMLKAVERFKVTYMPVSPPLVVAMAKSEVVMRYDLSSLRLIGCGGAPLGKEVAGRFKARFPDVEIVQGYGMTETGGGVSGMKSPDECDRYGSAGRLSCNLEAKIVDPETGEALSPMQQGELWLRGPMIMKGYVRDKEATDATLDTEGWLKTGDLCYFDSDGFLYIVDRLKELIKYKAYQVPPAELERYLQSIPEVADAAVIPYPDEDAGQIPMAYIVRRPGSKINEAQIMEIIAKKACLRITIQKDSKSCIYKHNPENSSRKDFEKGVSPYKKIRRVAFINTIPKTPAGKILRRELVKHALSGASSKL
ncbi:AMP-dependent synthetase and ligase family protein [Artemisia annua]|uniref:AMP-dependent synthetase and ligase family protein n=1 Tax=Artemisia annua TaxID=35608 RepID=A0A2U1MP23_ARTAN|nr:AMP-dependent synthetase and ligase family protein [Artemisia annua]